MSWRLGPQEGPPGQAWQRPRQLYEAASPFDQQLGCADLQTLRQLCFGPWDIILTAHNHAPFNAILQRQCFIASSQHLTRGTICPCGIDQSAFLSSFNNKGTGQAAMAVEASRRAATWGGIPIKHISLITVSSLLKLASSLADAFTSSHSRTQALFWYAPNPQLQFKLRYPFQPHEAILQYGRALTRQC